jgi:HAD superfamily hydrolase (TIGR01509 family)
MLFVFDCDGVIVDSEVIASAVDAELLAEIGYEITPEAVTRRFAGLTARAIADLIAAETGRPMPDDFIARTRAEIDRRIAAELKPVSGIAEVLDRLDGPRCVCSNSTGERLRMSLEKTGLHDRFAPHIFSAVEVGDKQPKPSPNVYLHAIAVFGIDPREAVVIEDTPPGVQAAKASGARVVGFTGASHTWPGHADLLTEAGAETVINRLADLPAVAEALMAWEGLAE